MLKTSMKNIYDTVDREIKDRFETKNPTDEQPTEYKRNGSELIDGEKIMNTHKYIIMPIIMHCRVSTPEPIEFKTRLGFDQHNFIMTKEKSVLTKIIKVFASEKYYYNKYYYIIIITIFYFKPQNYFYFSKHRLAIEIDDKGHNDGNIDYEINGKKKQ